LVEILNLGVALHLDLIEPEQVRPVIREQFLDLGLREGGEVAVEIRLRGIGVIPDIVLAVTVSGALRPIPVAVDGIIASKPEPGVTAGLG